MSCRYGGKSWIESTPGYDMQYELRPNAYNQVEVIKGAGHHVYVDAPSAFNEFINETCALIDRNGDGPRSARSSLLNDGTDVD